MVLAMGRQITNDFSWSKSRHDKFVECQRAYYLHYYGSWGGWDERADPATRQLYILKKLNSRFTWAGGVTHDAIKQALLAIRFGREVDPAAVIDRVHRLMRADFRHSMGKGYWREKLRKEFAGLVEHEYAMPVTGDEWKQNWHTVKSALEWFFASRWPALAKGLEKDQWLEVDEGFEHSAFQLDGTKIFAIPDFAYRERDGGAVVVDWKTGRAKEGYDDQVLGYALYLSLRYGIPVDRIRAQLVYLNDGVETEVHVDETAIAGFRERLAESVAKMRSLLADPAANVAQPEVFFPMTEKAETCARCVFRRVCGKDAPAAKVA